MIAKMPYITLKEINFKLHRLDKENETIITSLTFINFINISQG